VSESSDADLIRLVELICDGSRVDWNRIRSDRPDLQPILDELRLIETMMSVKQAAPPADDSPPSDSQWGHLRLLEKLGEGRFGEVFRAFDPTLEREVALKLVNPECSTIGPGADRFVEEARQLARVRHPNVLVVHGADRHDGRLGLWTDLVRGRTLEEWAADHGVLGEREAAGIGVDLCRALAAVHAADLVHRDVKTTNVMREDGGRILLMDFGPVADVALAAGDLPRIPSPGTPLAMAPEELRGEQPGPRTDIYALGVLLYRLVTGRYPTEATDLKELVGKHARGEATPLGDLRPDLPGEFVRIVEQAIDPSPARRFASAGAMERALLRSGVHGEVPKRRPALGGGRTIAWATVVLVFMAAIWIVVARLRSPGGHTVASDHVLPSLTPAATQPGPPQASATLMRDRGGRVVPLASGDRVGPGDALYLNFEGGELEHVYVVDEDQHGNAFVLFPVPGVDLRNPLAPGVSHRLPGSRRGSPIEWQVSSAGGQETILVVASRQPLPALEQELSRVARAASPRARADALPSGTWRGIGRLTEPAPVNRKDGAGVSRRIEIALADSTAARETWLWKIELENPGH